MTSSSYKKLCTEFYDLDKPEAPKDEVNFYLSHLKGLKRPILEPMCSSGPLLLPLLKHDLLVEGTDNSKEMLNSCKVRAPKSKP